ncbi:hypothetical protein SAICODRAFT_4814 [Saitoella complicata NRRL Y-17804]|uniref:UDENN domain-containing protein n=1 Tax=Saitoella complicata (strain BCRC 22490 / CBS 7301 / JCM 7358 / NBRC 10748 / NRRL Y-17804) TaxID=698492 RepID=A0A0E9N7U4_SAICN|nr:uncharacterized protein SAICODRAFT_4814 [Saitoella complicata NRRL Y-17804]ODQ55574.1 hypothetical protein SAICODRAFT_4814 [Saitoella complicata NRRL Y-17804]GAO45987.1 hypothetical protein G7K_0232-t1 [Saitoella complicata NRRL Y-17804]
MDMDEDSEITVCVVGFHHQRGPEVEYVYPDRGQELPPLLSFCALPDGAHLTEEDFSYFTLPAVTSSSTESTSNGDDDGKDEGESESIPKHPTVFGISCNRQLKASELLNRPADVTRSTIQKAVVVLSSKPLFFVRDKLGVVTRAYFAQRDFEDRAIIRDLWESLGGLVGGKDGEGRGRVTENEWNVGISLRGLLGHFKLKTLILVKALLLERKILFFGSTTEKLCTMQYALLSLLPEMMDHLEDASSPLLHTLETKLKRATSLKTSNKASLHAYLGFPLQIFGKGCFFGPYTPLQQLDMLEGPDTKAYLIGSTNALFLQQKDKHAEIVVNVDNATIEVYNPQLKDALLLTPSDKKWIEGLVSDVTASESNLTFTGSEDHIRAQFEEYLSNLVSTVKYDNFLTRHQYYNMASDTPLMPDVDGNPARDYGIPWIRAWRKTRNYEVWGRMTDDELFDIVEARHPGGNSLGISLGDVQMKLAAAAGELKIGERTAPAREAISNTFSNLWNNVESYRERKRLEAEEKVKEKTSAVPPVSTSATTSKPPSIGEKITSSEPATPTSTTAAAAAAVVTSKASAFASSWGSWAAEKRRNLLARKNSRDFTTSLTPSVTSNNGKERSVEGDFGHEHLSDEWRPFDVTTAPRTPSPMTTPPAMFPVQAGEKVEDLVKSEEKEEGEKPDDGVEGGEDKGDDEGVAGEVKEVEDGVGKAAVEADIHTHDEAEKVQEKEEDVAKEETHVDTEGKH